MKKRKKSKPKLKPRKLLKRPLRNPAELEQLSAWVTERRAKMRERGRVALVVAAILLAIGTLINLSGNPSSDGFILPGLLILAFTIALPTVVRRFWTHPRVLTAQRRLLQDRGLSDLDLEEPAVVLEELEQRIAAAESLLGREQPTAVDP